jgi:8-oxo-dGTP pyrophosphatase MutT (NUDIX family)
MDLGQLPSPFYRVSLKVLVLDEQKRLLMCQAPDGEWEPPGGGWEHGESIYECLNRELTEELGVKIKSLGNIMTAYTGFNKRGFKTIKIAYSAELESLDFQYGDKGGAKFVTKEELLLLKMSTDEEKLKEQLDIIWPKSS